MFLPFTKQSVEKTHQISLEILDKVGIEVGSKKALAILKEKGARIIPDKKRACITPLMVEKALEDVPSSFTLYGRGGHREARFRRKNMLFGSSGVPSVVYDLETGQRRQAQLEDFIGITRLLDGLSHVDVVTDTLTFSGVSGEQRDTHALFHLANNTQKPLTLHITFTDERSFNRLITLTNLLKETVFEGKQFVIFRISPLMSPLKLDDTQLNHLISAARENIPVYPVSMPQAGVSSPATLAGTLAVANAEILALLVIVQAAKPGTAFVYGPVPDTTNFMTGQMLTASPETVLLNAAATQLADYYNLPNWATVGRTDSNILDIQAGYEQSLGVPLVALSGATYMSAVGGFLESVCAVSFEKFVIDNEIVGMTKRILKGIKTDPEHYAFELISSVGPGGNFLDQHHTVKYMREEYFTPTVSELSGWNEWKRNGEPTALQRAHKRATEIIESLPASPLSPEIVNRIKKVFPDIIRDIS